MLTRQMKLKQHYRARGLCIECGEKPNPWYSLIKCVLCLNRDRDRKRVKNKVKRHNIRYIRF